MTPNSPAIVTRGLTRRFGRVTALEDVNFVAPAGAVLGLLGPNGSGKTTLLSILAGFIAPTSGEFQLLGDGDHNRALARTGSLISRPLLWPHLSCRDNLLCAQGIGSHRRDPDEVDNLLAQVGLDGAAADRKFGRCSTGMKQRLGIAAALLNDPELLLLDEPTTGLDPEGMVEIRELIRSLGQTPGRTIIMSSHLLHEVELTCGHYAIIFRGKLADQGPVAEPPLASPATQISTTDNARALPFLLERGWSATAGGVNNTIDTTGNAVGPPSDRTTAPPESLLVETVPGEEWKVARDLAEIGVYPSAIRPGESSRPSGTLEQKYLAAVGRLDATGAELS